MKRTTPFIASLCAGVALLLAAEVKTDYEHSADFSRYHSYSWIKADAEDSLWADRIQHDVDSQLMAKGWNRVDNGGDASVAAIGSVKTERQLNTFYDGFPGWRWGGFGEATTTVERVPIGTLQVDIFDGSSKKLIWRATAENTLAGKPEKNEKKLEKTVEEMFKKFPPQSRG